MKRLRVAAIQAALSIGLILTLGMLATTQADTGINATFSGYGTVGGTLTSDGNYQYVHDSSEFSGAGHQFDVGLDSRIGVQAVVDFGLGFSVTAQEVAKQRGDNTFSPGTEWLFLQYAPDADWKFRLGRVALATFLYSDSRNVGYAAPWFNAPNEVYAGEPYQNLDGAEIVWHHMLGSIGIGLKGAYGNTSQPGEYDGGVRDEKVKSMYNVAATLEYGDFLFRVAQTSLNIPVAVPLSATYSVNFNLKDTFNSVGMQYDNGTAILLSEFAKRTENNVLTFGLPLSASSEWYVAGGWRFGKFTPLVSYAQFKPLMSLEFPAGKYSTPSLSLRYDVVSNVALKAQLSRAQAGNTLYWAAANTASDERVNVFSLGADFVF